MPLEGGSDSAEKVVGGYQILPYLFTGTPRWVEILSLETGGPLGFLYVPTFVRDKGTENYVIIMQV